MNKDEAKLLAQQEFKRRGWPWTEPVIVHWGVFSFTVWTNAKARGGNGIIKIRKKDGMIISAEMSPR